MQLRIQYTDGRKQHWLARLEFGCALLPLATLLGVYFGQRPTADELRQTAENGIGSVFQMCGKRTTTFAKIALSPSSESSPVESHGWLLTISRKERLRAVQGTTIRQ